MFNIIIDSEDSINPVTSISTRNYGFDFGTQEEGEYKLSHTIKTYDHQGLIAGLDFLSVHLSLGSAMANYAAGSEITAQTESLIGFVFFEDRIFRSVDSNPKIKMKLNNTASQFQIMLRKADGSPVTADLKYRMILSFEKCSCKH